MKAYSSLMDHLKSKEEQKPIDKDVLDRKQERFDELDPKVQPIVKTAEGKSGRKLVLTSKGKDVVKTKEGDKRSSEEAAGLDGAGYV